MVNVKQPIRLNRKHKRLAFSIAFLLPAFGLYTVFLIVPMLSASYYSMLNWNGVTEATFVGLGNFTFLFTEDRHFYTVLQNTIISIFSGVFIQLPIALVLAYIVYRTVRGFHFFQSVYFVPVVISAAVIGLMFSLFVNPDFGALNALLRAVGLEHLIRNWLTDPDIVLFTVIFPGIWQYIGFHFVIFLAAMQSIPTELNESATIDGANVVQIFFHIVVPNVVGIMKVCIVICCVGAIRTFDIPFMMTHGGPGAQSSFLSVFMYREAFINSSLGKGTAIAVIMLIMALLATVLVNSIFNAIERKDGNA